MIYNRYDIINDISFRCIPPEYACVGPEILSKLVNEAIMSRVDRNIHNDPANHPWMVRPNSASFPLRFCKTSLAIVSPQVQNHGSYGKLRYGLLVLTQHAAKTQFGRAAHVANFRTALHNLAISIHVHGNLKGARPALLSGEASRIARLPGRRQLLISDARDKGVVFTAIVVADLGVPFGVPVVQSGLVPDNTAQARARS